MSDVRKRVKVTDKDNRGVGKEPASVDEWLLPAYLRTVAALASVYIRMDPSTDSAVQSELSKSHSPENDSLRNENDSLRNENDSLRNEAKSESKLLTAMRLLEKCVQRMEVILGRAHPETMVRAVRCVPSYYWVNTELALR